MMHDALAQARRAAELNEVPVGALILRNGVLIATAHNRVETDFDSTAHAEILVIRDACDKLGKKYLDDCEIIVTLEPCPMCAHAISLARLKRLTFGAYDIKGGGVEHGPRIFSQPTCHYKPEVVGGVMESDCAALLTGFFASKR